MCYAQILKFLGRSGNNILQLVNCLYCAFEVNKCHKIVFPMQRLLAKKEIQNRSKDQCRCNRRFTDSKNYFFSSLSVGSMRDIAQIYIVPNLKNLVLPRVDPDPEHIFIHIRSGDIFKERPHSHYFPPPLDYYRYLIERYPRSTIVYENEMNPCIKILKEKYQNIHFQSTSLLDDLATLCRASHLAIGYGSFGLLVYLLSSNITTLYIPSYFENDTFLYRLDWRKHGLSKLESVDLKDYRSKMGNRWTNSKTQIQLMLNYKVSSGKT